MKHTLGVLSLCFLATWTAAARRPLCSIETMFSNETLLTQTFSSIIQGDRRALECLAGCGLYTVNLTMGHVIRPLAGPGYFMFEDCIKKGVRTADTCVITDCVLDLIYSTIKLAKSAGMDIPYQDSIECFIGHVKSKYTVQHTTEEIFAAHQLTSSPHHMKTSPPTELLKPEPTHQPESPSHTSAATKTVLHICGYLLLAVSVSHT